MQDAAAATGMRTPFAATFTRALAAAIALTPRMLRSCRMTALAGALAPATILTLCTALLGCGDNGSKAPPAPGSLEGTVTEVNSGAPVTDAVLALVDVRQMTVASGIESTDVAGHYRFDAVAPGDYAALVFHDSLVVRERSASQAHVNSKKVTTFDINLVSSDLFGAPVYYIEGNVADSQTAAPVAGAFVGPAMAFNGDPEEYAGGWAFRSAVTDSFGHFRAPAFRLQFLSGEEGLAPITITKEGYEPYTLIGQGVSIPTLVPPLLPVPTGDDGTLHADVALTPLGSGGMGPHGAGAIKGRVMSFGEPVVGVLVGAAITAVSDPDTFKTPPTSRIPAPRKVTHTDNMGRFMLEGLTPGDYTVDPAYLDNDGYAKLFNQSPTAFVCVVVDSQTCDLGELQMGRAITPVSPAPHSTVRDTTPEFRWSAIAGPPGYGHVTYSIEYGTGFSLDDGSSEDLEEPRWQMPDSQALAPGDHVRWSVTARAQNLATLQTEDIAIFEWPATFSVAK